jgi:hypothetical protein
MRDVLIHMGVPPSVASQIETRWDLPSFPVLVAAFIQIGAIIYLTKVHTVWAWVKDRPTL